MRRIVVWLCLEGVTEYGLGRNLTQATENGVTHCNTKPFVFLGRV